MKLGSFTRHLGLAVVAVFVVAACGNTGGGGAATCSAAKTAKSAADCGGMDALVKAAPAAGKLNGMALPPAWANNGAILEGFHAMYGLATTSDHPEGSS